MTGRAGRTCCQAGAGLSQSPGRSTRRRGPGAAHPARRQRRGTAMGRPRQACREGLRRSGDSLEGRQPVPAADPPPPRRRSARRPPRRRSSLPSGGATTGIAGRVAAAGRAWHRSGTLVAEAAHSASGAGCRRWPGGVVSRAPQERRAARPHETARVSCPPRLRLCPTGRVLGSRPWPIRPLQATKRPAGAAAARTAAAAAPAGAAPAARRAAAGRRRPRAPEDCSGGGGCGGVSSSSALRSKGRRTLPAAGATSLSAPLRRPGCGAGFATRSLPASLRAPLRGRRGPRADWTRTSSTRTTPMTSAGPTGRACWTPGRWIPADWQPQSGGKELVGGPKPPTEQSPCRGRQAGGRTHGRAAAPRTTVTARRRGGSRYSSGADPTSSSNRTESSSRSCSGPAAGETTTPPLLLQTIFALRPPLPPIRTTRRGCWQSSSCARRSVRPWLRNTIDQPPWRRGTRPRFATATATALQVTTCLPPWQSCERWTAWPAAGQPTVRFRLDRARFRL